jgi:hypothetical protein
MIASVFARVLVMTTESKPKTNILEVVERLAISSRRRRGLPDYPPTTTSRWYDPHMYWPTTMSWGRRALINGLRERLGDRRFAMFMADVFAEHCKNDIAAYANILVMEHKAHPGDPAYLRIAVDHLPELCEFWDKAHPEGRMRKILRKMWE